MKFLRRGESGAISSAAAVTLLSFLLGGGAAAAAVGTRVSTPRPHDGHAVQTGPKDVVAPEDIIDYGG